MIMHFLHLGSMVPCKMYDSYKLRDSRKFVYSIRSGITQAMELPTMH